MFVLTWVALWNCFFNPATDILPSAEKQTRLKNKPCWFSLDQNPNPEHRGKSFSWIQSGTLGWNRRNRTEQPEPSRTKEPSWIYFQSAREKRQQRSSNREMRHPSGNIWGAGGKRNKKFKDPQNSKVKDQNHGVMHHYDWNKCM